MNGFVLAGGLSSRMGRDKALLELDGRPLIEHAVARLRALGLEPRICGARPGLEKFAPTIPDNLPGCGPLGGIEAALTASDEELNLFVAVDLPRLPAAFLRWMMERARATEAIATVPICEGRPQPLCAICSRRLLPGMRAALEAGKYKLLTAVTESAASLAERVDTFTVESLAAALIPGLWPANPPIREWFRNINTPEEFAALLQATAGSIGRNPIS